MITVLVSIRSFISRPMFLSQSLSSLILMGVFLGTSLESYGSIPDPHFKADLEIKKINEKPEVYQNFKKILNLKKNSQMNLFLVLNDQANKSPKKLVLELEGETSEFKIVSKKKGSCGEIEYLGDFTNNQPVDRLFGYQIQLTLVDHTQNQCLKPSEQNWEATLSLKKKILLEKGKEYRSAGQVVFSGNPVKVMTWN